MIPKVDIPKIIVYSDVNPDVHDESPFELTFNEDSIRKSLDAIFTTPYGSRVFRRRFGSKANEILHEPVDEFTASRMETMLRDTASLWESRIDKLAIKVLPDRSNQQFYVEMSYEIPGLDGKLVSYKFNISK